MNIGDNRPIEVGRDHCWLLRITGVCFPTASPFSKASLPKLTKRIVDQLQPNTTRDVFTWDSELRGFGIRVKPSGIASFLIQYRNAYGHTRRMVLGRVGTLTPDEARAVAREKLAAVARGTDPSAERHSAREGVTVAEVCDWYLGAAMSGAILGKGGRPIKASTLAMDRSRIAVHVKPLLGARSVLSLSLHDIEKMQADIAVGRSAKSRYRGRGAAVAGGPGVASRTASMLRTILEHAMRKRLIPFNPATGLRRLADKRRERWLSNAEIGALGAALLEAEATCENRSSLAAVRFMLLTGFRRMEVLGLRSSWVDKDGRYVRFPDTKTGAQTRVIASSAFDAISGLLGEGWVFNASRGTGHLIGFPKILERLCKKAQLSGVTAHTLRHTFASVAAELGFTEMTVAALLGHRSRGITQRYVHLDTALQVAADKTAARIALLLASEHDKVVELDKRRA